MIFYCRYHRKRIPKKKALVYCMNKKNCWAFKIFTSKNKLKKYDDRTRNF